MCLQTTLEERKKKTRRLQMKGTMIMRMVRRFCFVVIVNIIVIRMLDAVRAAKKQTKKNVKENKVKEADYDNGE